MTTYSNLAAFRIERRKISVAVFADVRLDYTGSRELASRHDKALESVGRYVEWIRRNFYIQAAALEVARSGTESCANKFAEQIIGQLREAAVPVFEVQLRDLLTSFAHPGLRFRTELHQVVSSIWPILAGADTHPSCLDAAALGLYVQVERLFAR